MQPWFKVVKPYPFIESLGNQEELFVADLGDVLTGTAHPIYQDPELFVKTTHFTSGLIQFLESVLMKITTGEGNSVIRLQSQFGGGKTHGIIAVHHLLTNQRFFDGKITKFPHNFSPKIVRMLGTHLNPIKGRKVENIRISTLWGELAYQLGGIEEFNSLRENDQERISPGKTTLLSLLSSYQPVIILLDEFTEYITKAKGVTVTKSNLGLQTLIFLQELSECLRSLEKSVLIISLPEREYEETGDKEKPLLIEIDHILSRLDSLIIPSERSDLFQIVRKKLIDDIIDAESLSKIVSDISSYYIDNKTEFPPHSSTSSYSSLLENSFPFHPSTVELLIDNWSKLPSFQGTRTILSILAKVLFDQQQKKSNNPIITPSDILYQQKSQKSFYYRHLPLKFIEILNYELKVFKESTDLKSDSREWKKLGNKIISTIFLYSIPKNNNIGVNFQEINLAVWKPDIDLILISEVINYLTQSMEFLHTKDRRHLLSEKVNINFKIKDLKNKLEEEALKEIKDKISSQRVEFPINVIVWPQSSDRIPDNPKLKLVFASPDREELEIKSWIQSRGERFRKYQNTILIAQVNTTNFYGLKTIIQEKKAIEKLIQDKENTRLTRVEQKNLNLRLKAIKKEATFSFNRIYLEFTDSINHYHLSPPKSPGNPFLEWMIGELIKDEVIVNYIRPQYIKRYFFKEKRKIDTLSILDQFLKNLNMPKLMKVQILRNAILEGIKTKIFTLEFLSEVGTSSISKKEALSTIDISFDSTEILEIPDDFHGTSTESKNEQAKDQLDDNQREILFDFSNLNLKELQLIKKGIIEPLEKNKGQYQLGMTIHLKNPEEIKNKMILSLIKETATQIGGKVKKEE